MAKNGGEGLRDYNNRVARHLGEYFEDIQNIEILLNGKAENLMGGVFYTHEDNTPTPFKQLFALGAQFRSKGEEVKRYEKELLVEDLSATNDAHYVARLKGFFKKYKGVVRSLKALYKDEYSLRKETNGKGKGTGQDNYVGIYRQLYLDSKTKLEILHFELKELEYERSRLLKKEISRDGYDSNLSWFKKIEYVLKEQSCVMTLSQIAESLIAHEPTLLKGSKRDLIMLLSSICIQNINTKRLNRTGENNTTPYFYGLASYFDPAGKVLENYLPNDS